MRPQPELLCIEKPCSYCGATLEVTSAEVGGEPRLHPYVCLQCHKTDGIVCTGHPHVRVLHPRTDGRTNTYQETVF